MVYVFQTKWRHRELSREKLDHLVHPSTVSSQTDLPAVLPACPALGTFSPSMRIGMLFSSLFPPLNVSSDFPVSPRETTSAPSLMPPHRCRGCSGPIVVTTERSWSMLLSYPGLCMAVLTRWALPSSHGGTTASPPAGGHGE